MEAHDDADKEGLFEKAEGHVVQIQKNLKEVLPTMAQMVKNLPSVQETQVRSLGREDPVQKGMTTHCSILACRIPWAEEPGGLQSTGLQSQTRLSDFTFTIRFHSLEKEMATHSIILAWRIPGMGEPGGLLSMGSHRVGHD